MKRGVWLGVGFFLHVAFARFWSGKLVWQRILDVYEKELGLNFPWGHVCIGRSMMLFGY